MITGTYLVEDKSPSEPWMGVTRFALLNNNPPQGCMWVQGQTDEETRHNKTGEHVARSLVKHVKRLTA